MNTFQVKLDVIEHVSSQFILNNTRRSILWYLSKLCNKRICISNRKVCNFEDHTELFARFQDCSYFFSNNLFIWKKIQVSDVYVLANCISNLPRFSVLILHLFQTFPVEVFHIPHLYPWVCEWNSGNRREKSNFWQGEWGQEFGCCVGNKSNQQWIKKKILFHMKRK